MSKYSELVKSLSEKDILSQFSSDVIPISKRPNSKSSDIPIEANGEFSRYDKEQIKLMNENCIVLDYNDVVVGTATKKACHLMANIERGLLHRAFSCFVFDSNGKLLLQRRAEEKITFPLLWTNTCCSHPLCVDDEIGDVSKKGDLNKNVAGVINAAIRKLNHELGIPSNELKENGKFHFLNRIHYMAACNDADNRWGEHEIDYILIYKVDANKFLTVNPNYNEVDNYMWVSKERFQNMLKDKDYYHFTPWFKIICENYLFAWWDQLDDLSKVENDTNIYRML